MCPHCGLLLNRRNVRLHILRRHTPIKTDISALNHLKSQCVDYRNGVYAVAKAFSAPNTPIQIIRKTWGSEQRTICELDICRINTEFAERSNIRSYEYHHFRSLAYCPPAERDISLLTEQGLQTMVDDRWFGKDKKERCLSRQREAIDAGVPLSCPFVGPAIKNTFLCSSPPFPTTAGLVESWLPMMPKQFLGIVLVLNQGSHAFTKMLQSGTYLKWTGHSRSVEEDRIAQHFPTNVEGFEEESVSDG